MSVCVLCVIVRICVWCVYENVVCEWGVCVSVCVVCVIMRVCGCGVCEWCAVEEIPLCYTSLPAISALL